MEPVRGTRATLVDLLDRILDKGLIINADVIISVAGIPLIGVNLRAALAGMETMLKYGVMQAWDERIRDREREYRKSQEINLFKEEKVALKIFGSCYYSKGIYTAWKPGHIYLTDKRLLLWNREFDDIIFQIPLKKIKAILIDQEDHSSQKREVLHLVDQDNRLYRLQAEETHRLKEAIELNLEAVGLVLEENPALPEFEKEPIRFLLEGERITNQGVIWHLTSGAGILGMTWKPGHLYLTNKRLCWWQDFDQKIAFDIPIEEMIAAVEERRNLSPVIKDKEVLDVVYNADGTKTVASFSGKEIDEWKNVLNSIIVKINRDEEKNFCPLT